MKYLFLIFVFSTAILFPQEDPFITVETNASVELPADEIIFSVNLDSEDRDPQKAYDKHKQREKNLLSILKEFGIADSNITFSLLNINNINMQPNENTYRTSQFVNVRLPDINKYEAFQIALLSNGIYSFSGQFSSSDMSKGKEDALAEAVKKARSEAEILARNLNKKIGEVLEAELVGGNIIFDRSLSFSMEKGGNLINIPQYVQVSTNIKVKFELVD